MRKDGVLQAEVTLEVPFFDVDVMEVVWHGHYVKYLELARCALLDRIDYNYAKMRASGFAWPVIDLQLRYVRGARFGQKIVVRADLVEWESKLKINYLISCAESGERLTRATSVQVAVHMETQEMQFVAPRAFIDAVERAIS
jgi:acyl-CoA thioester hydrolase